MELKTPQVWELTLDDGSPLAYRLTPNSSLLFAGWSYERVDGASFERMDMAWMEARGLLQSLIGAHSTPTYVPSARRLS